MNFRGNPCVWNCISPIGRQCASGLSLLLLSCRSFLSAAAHGLIGRPPGTFWPTSRNIAIGGVPGGATGAGCTAPAGRRAAPQPAEVRLAVRRSRHRRVHIRLALGVLRHSARGIAPATAPAERGATVTTNATTDNQRTTRFIRASLTRTSVLCSTRVRIVLGGGVFRSAWE